VANALWGRGLGALGDDRRQAWIITTGNRQFRASIVVAFAHTEMA
jgi:hypothetical protein